MKDKPYTITTKRGYEVDLPDRDNELEISFGWETDKIWLSKEDVLKLLERFD